MNLLFWISGSECVSNRQSHMTSVNEDSSHHKCLEILMVHHWGAWLWQFNTRSELLIRNKRFVSFVSSVLKSPITRYCWIIVIILFFLVHKKYSRRFITLRLNHCCHMNCFKYVFSSFLGIKKCYLSCWQCRPHWAIGFYQKYLNLCSEDERRSYGCGATWGWVINDRNFIFGLTKPLRLISRLVFQATQQLVNVIIVNM